MEVGNNHLKLIVMDNFLEFGKKVDAHLKLMRGIEQEKFSHIVPVELPRFHNGEAKAVIKESIRAQDVFILTDVGNYSCTYEMHGFMNHKSPDDHFQDTKRVISACNGSASRVSVIMPLLYEARQHKKKGRESLDCSVGLKELENLGVKQIITFDVHNKDACDNAVSPYTTFESPYPTYSILNKFIDTEEIDFHNLLIVSPDTGAVDRARYYADMLKTDIGIFHKRRDFSKIVNGKNPIVAHEYLGKEVTDKNVLIVDDMIASGQSIIEVAEDLKQRGAKKIYLIASFALFSDGKSSIDVFQNAYQNKVFDKLYTTNLTYVPDSVKSLPWFQEVDCSKYTAKIIHTLNNNESMTPLLNGKAKILTKIENKKNFDKK